MASYLLVSLKLAARRSHVIVAEGRRFLFPTLTASPNGTIFSGWGGACNGNDPTCTITVNEVLNVSATFTSIFTLQVSAKGGSGTIVGTPDGVQGTTINCGRSCQAKFGQGTSVTLTATPAAGLRFLNWSGDCAGTSPTCTLTITRSAKAEANFSK